MVTKIIETGGKKVSLDLVYEHAHGKWYTYSNIEDFPPVRAVSANFVVEEIEQLGTSRELLQDAFKLIQGEIDGIVTDKDGSLNTISKVANNMSFILDYTAQPRVLQQLATYYFLIEGEDPLKYESEFQKKKFEIWEQDPSCTFFFMVELGKVINSFSAKLQQVTEKSLKEMLLISKKVQAQTGLRI